MKMTIVSAHSPKWSNQDQSSITLRAIFAELGKEVPFTASPNDPELHGREIYQRAISGEFGKVGEYQPIVYTNEQMAAYVRSKRNALLRSSDWSQFTDVPVSVRDSWSAYRSMLRKLPEQNGFPFDVEWPKTPS